MTTFQWELFYIYKIIDVFLSASEHASCCFPAFETEREERERLEQEQREEEEREYQERLRKLEEQERKQRARQQEIEERERRREEERRGPPEEKAKVQFFSFVSFYSWSELTIDS